MNRIFEFKMSIIRKSINKYRDYISLFYDFSNLLKFSLDGRKKCLVYGNCQTHPLTRILSANKEFSHQYEIIKFKPVFRIDRSDLENLKTICQEVDLFIYQPVKSGYRGIEELGTNYLQTLLKSQSHSISFHSLYFNVYNPEIIYIKKPDSIDEDKVFIGPFGDYHNKNIIDMFIRGCKITEVIEFLHNPEALDRTKIQEKFRLSIEELIKRENAFEIDVKIANYIRDNYQSRRLFWSMNHPSNDVIIKCAYDILEGIGISTTSVSKSFFMKSLTSIEFLNGTYFSIHPAICEALELKFPNPNLYFNNGMAFSLNDAASKFFRFYDKNPQVVEEYVRTQQK